ncbi:hypothetical protein [Chromobacterium phragmitis]|uniref:Uncharacterized protein n=1 Tax=Chromobacterium phragmitis TaxID=2202141 RepID=A0ABV0J1D8_9NEIS
MIDTGKPFDLEALRKTMPWRVVSGGKGKLVVVDKENREVDMGDMLNTLEVISMKLAQ